MNKTEKLVSLYRHAILEKQLATGDRLPSLRKLCDSHQVSLTTAQHAYAELERQGLIESLPRSGFRVRQRPSEARTAPPQTEDWRMEHFTTALPMPWGCPFMNPALINTTPMNRALSRVLQDYRHALSATDLEGYDGLRRELALHYLAQGIPLDSRELLITCGGMEALTLAIRAVASVSGKTDMLVLTPAFPAALEQLRQQGMRIISVEARPDGSLDMNRVESLLAAKPAGMLLMSNFQHPTGQVMPDGQKQALVSLAAAHGVYLIEDDTYRELYFGSAAPKPLKSWDDSGCVLHCSSFSKSLAPGYRVGWIAAGRLGDTLRGLKLYSSLGTPLPSQMALARLLASGQHSDMLERLRHTLSERMQAVRQQVERHFPAQSGLSQPLGGYFQWVMLPEGFDTGALLPLAIEQGIHYAPSRLFRPENSAANGLRLNVSFYDPVQQQHGMALLGELLRHGPN
ncbi:PLP-dependent aminotransferase family protein [uncultured Aquitalea sp.]|uniref:aminotransferase-like domain-containing protein n=1 Tax=uncultured Aquitalea sp. TaxID=540272 RepID=UPI0026014149|nr:PLP-dependent aminotransferase family protein [uncultured Aquitalea sp.]